MPNKTQLYYIKMAAVAVRLFVFLPALLWLAISIDMVTMLSLRERFDWKVFTIYTTYAAICLLPAPLKLMASRVFFSLLLMVSAAISVIYCASALGVQWPVILLGMKRSPIDKEYGYGLVLSIACGLAPILLVLLKKLIQVYSQKTE